MQYSTVQISHKLALAINTMRSIMCEEFGPQGFEFRITTPWGKVISSTDVMHFALVKCRKCGRETHETPGQKYCGDGSDKDNGHDYVALDPGESINPKYLGGK